MVGAAVAAFGLLVAADPSHADWPVARAEAICDATADTVTVLANIPDGQESLNKQVNVKIDGVFAGTAPVETPTSFPVPHAVEHSVAIQYFWTNPDTGNPEIEPWGNPVIVTTTPAANCEPPTTETAPPATTEPPATAPPDTTPASDSSACEQEQQAGNDVCLLGTTTTAGASVLDGGVTAECVIDADGNAHNPATGEDCLPATGRDVTGQIVFGAVIFLVGLATLLVVKFWPRKRAVA